MIQCDTVAVYNTNNYFSNFAHNPPNGGLWAKLNYENLLSVEY